MENIKRKLRFLPGLKLATAQAPTNGEHKKSLLNHGSSRHFSKRTKALVGCTLIVVILVSCFIFYPRANTTPTPSDIIPVSSPDGSPNGTNNTNGTPNHPTSTPQEPWSPFVIPFLQPDYSYQVVKNNNLTKETWVKVAELSWAYFKVGTGVDSTTGLPGSGPGCPYFTDWDLGVYVQAVLDAQAIGLVGVNGQWSANDRLEKVVTFLETRELNATTHYPYWFYDANGNNYKQESDRAPGVDVADTGRLFVALNNAKTYAKTNDPTLATRIDNFVYNRNGNRSDYAALVPSLKAESTISNSIYSYFVIAGFAGFWPNELGQAQTNIVNNMMNSGTVTTPEGVTLPQGRLLGDPLYGAIFDLNNNPPQLTTIANQVYLAHQEYYNKNEVYRAFSEGPTISNDWAYEWVVFGNKTWVVTTTNGDPNLKPIVYTKIAFSFLAIYNTTFARNMVIWLEETLPKPENGYYNGLSEDGTQLSGSGIHTVGLILGAARYAIQHYPKT